MGYIATHNGYGIEFMDTYADCVEWVFNKVRELQEEHNMKLELIDRLKSEKGFCWIYQYRTLYCEVFTITER